MRCLWVRAQYGADVTRKRRMCSKPSCSEPAVATLTYVYSDCTAVLGPLATQAEPHCYDLCTRHSERLTAPVGWEILRLEPDLEALKLSGDDIEALANAVREAARPGGGSGSAGRSGDGAGRPAHSEVSRKGHLRVLRPID